MRISTLLARNLAWYWRTNLAVLLGVATAVGVLGGALLVGDSVRASLRDLVLARLGNTDDVISSNGFFREELAAAPGLLSYVQRIHRPATTPQSQTATKETISRRGSTI